MSVSPGHVAFRSGGAFHKDLKRRVDAYLASAGTPSWGGVAIRWKTAILIGWLVASYSLLMFAHPPLWLGGLLAVSLALAFAGMGFCVMHDANHGTWTRSPGLNRAVGFIGDLLGVSSYVWRHKHNVLHHTYTNIAGHDDDLEAGPLLRFAPWQKHRFFHRAQSLYVWLLYGLFPMRWMIFDDFRDLIRGRIGESPLPRPGRRELLGFLGGKAFFFGWTLVLPLALHPAWQVLAVWLVTSIALGNVLATTFQLAHCTTVTRFDEPLSMTPGSDWAAHQVATTANFAPRNPVLTWYLGGLNYQIEHHLFPRLSHTHYPALSEIVAETCSAHGLDYRAAPTLRRALGDHVRWLTELGRAPLQQRASAS